MSFRRHGTGPILTRADVHAPPELVDPSSVFNPGAIRDGELTRLLLRTQSRGRETFLVPATSTDGVHFEVGSTPIRIRGLEDVGERVHHVYDPRLTRVDDEVLMVFAADVDGACRLGVARTADFADYELVSFDTARDARNGVLFPERFPGPPEPDGTGGPGGERWLRLERPNATALESGVVTGDQIWLAESPDFVTWRPVAPVMSGRPHYWDELIGSGPPPIRTAAGWLHVYHGVATHLNAGIYQAGVCLLDLADPSKVIARGRQNVLEPREPWELMGQVPNVVFPSGATVDRVDEAGNAPPEAVVHLYYGAADTCVGLATASVADLIAAARDE